MGRDLLGLVAQFARHHGGRGAAHRSAAARVRAEPVRGVVGVPLLDHDVHGGDAQLLGYDLRERRLMTLALAFHTELEDRFPSRVDA